MIYSCVSENTPFINWDITITSDEGRHIVSWTQSHFTNNGRIRREREPIQAVLEVTYSNSTSIASTITLPMEPQTYTIQCNSIIARNIPRSSIASKSAILSLLKNILQHFIFPIVQKVCIKVNKATYLLGYCA